MNFVPSILAAPPMAIYGTEEPERNRANQVIQSRLIAEPQYQAVLKLVEKYLPKFDVTNMVCAMHMCALTARDHEMLKRQIQFDPSFITLFHSLKEQVIGHVDELTTRTCSDLLWSCSRLDIFDSDLFNEIIADASRRLEMYSAQGISLLVFALGYVGQRPRAVFMQALVRELRSRIETEFDQQAISMVIYGMMRLGIRDDRLMKIVTEHMIRTGFDRTEPVSVVCIAFAYSKLEYWNENIFASMGRSLIDCVKDLSPRLMVMSSLCFARSAGNLKESHFVMDELLRNAEKRMQEFDNRSLATLAFAAGKYHQLKEEIETYKPSSMGMAGLTFDSKNSFAEEIAQEVERRTYESFTMSEINLISYSLMRMKTRDEGFLEKVASQFARNAAELTSIEIVNAVYAFGQLEYVHLQFVHAMVVEIKRRNLLDEMDTLEVATLVYSLARCRIYEEEIMDKAAVIACKKVHEFEPTAVSMLIWGMAVLNSTTHAEPLVSAILEDFNYRFSSYNSVGAAVIFWSSSLLAGTSSAIWAMKGFFQPGFWSQPFEEKQYSMLYHMYAALRVEEGICAEDLEGWYMCRRLYEESTGERMGSQNQRLAERLAMQTISHRANAMVPALKGFREAGVRADIVIEKLQLVIEVEGPQRMTIPLDKTMAEIGDEEVFGTPEEVIQEVRTAVECGLTGSAAFKRRLLRKCGWRVVTVSFDENEEYIADALGTMAKQDDGGDSGAEGTEEEQTAEASGDPEDGQDSGEESTESSEAPKAADAPASSSSGGTITYTDETITEDSLSDEAANSSEYERKVREKHRLAYQELRRRILEERGNAAASAAYSNHLEYRRWQVRLEKEVFKEMLAEL